MEKFSINIRKRQRKLKKTLESRTENVSPIVMRLN